MTEITWGDREKERVGQVWHENTIEDRNKFRLSWMSHETIVSHVNRVRFGDPSQWPDIWFKQTYVPRRVERALSLGCGTGAFERCILRLGICASLDGYDLSPAAVRQASETAQAEGLANARFEVRDINEIRIEKKRYDIVFLHHALHHFVKLEHVIEQISRGLKRRGLLYMDDYVGPSRFQWTDRQLQAINAILPVLPERYRRMKDDTGTPTGVKERIERPDIEGMIRSDPSEAVRSSEILDHVGKKFRILKRMDYGGTILHTLLASIAFNFDPADEKDNTILRLIALFEKTLIDIGYLSSDFTMIIARKRSCLGF